MCSGHAASEDTPHSGPVKEAVLTEEPREAVFPISIRFPFTEKGSGLFSLHFDKHLLLLDYLVVFKSLFSFFRWEMCGFVPYKWKCMNTPEYMAMWNLRFGVTGIRKKEFVAFQPVDEELFINQKTLSICLFWAKKKKKGRTRKKNNQLKLSCNLYIKEMYGLSAL